MSEGQEKLSGSDEEKLAEAMRGMRVELITSTDWHTRPMPRRAGKPGYNRPPGSGGSV